MRNLKKILALVLAFAMTFALTASAATFTDQATIGGDYVDDVNMLVELGVIAGYPDGSFGPQKNITRAEFAKMAYTLKYGSDTDGNLFAAQKSQFTDVEGNDMVNWAKGYINYCANQKIVSGVGNNKFNPTGNITVAEAAKMILVIMGCDPAKEGFTGSNWMANTVAKAIDLGVFNGWAGDPTSLATRELVAKLMRNAIFSPVYEYSAITGGGSQLNALGTDYNQTLGEKTMGLKSVTGLVVANERYALDTDEEGEALEPSNGTVAETGLDSEESIIYYEGKDKDGNVNNYIITIDRALPDEMLGNKVNVFFKADVSSSAEYNYKNVEVLGNVLVNNDTVVYDVDAIAADVYPDGESNSATEVLPYIAFQTADGEKQIKADKRLVEKYARNVDAQLQEDVIAAFSAYGYVFDTSVSDDDAIIGTTDNILDDMGYPVLSKYRFVSVDGGKTYSYIFKTVTDATDKVAYGSVTHYSADKGTISLTNVGSVDLEECVIVDELAIDDAVVFYRDNGKLVIEKVDVITGAVESFTDKGVMIGGNEYFAWADCAEVDNGNLFQYYMDNKSAQGANTTYYVYNNLIMEILADEVVSAVEDYAVITRSYYDSDMDTAYVKLGFGDNSEGTYQVGKTYLKNSREPNDAANINNRAQDFANNALFGIVVKYKVRDNGSLDLSGQDFNEILTFGNTTTKYSADKSVRVTKGNLDGYYGLNDNTLVFALYGNPCYVIDDEEVKMNATDEDYAPIKAKAYKLNELVDMTANGIETLYIGKTPETDPVVSYVLNSKTSNNKYIVCAAMTVGETLASANIAYKESRALGYVVNAMQYYNSASDSYYAELTLINEDGLFTAKTIENVTNLNAIEILKDGVIGNISDARSENCMFAAGSFVRYDMNADGVITALTYEGGELEDIKTKYTPGVNSGFYLVNVSAERNGILTFYNTDEAIEDVKSASTVSCEFHEDGYDIIGIDDDKYIGETLTKVSSRATDLAVGVGNAIIEIDEQQIVRVFSFVDGYSK